MRSTSAASVLIKRLSTVATSAKTFPGARLAEEESAEEESAEEDVVEEGLVEEDVCGKARAGVAMGTCVLDNDLHNGHVNSFNRFNWDATIRRRWRWVRRYSSKQVECTPCEQKRTKGLARTARFATQWFEGFEGFEGFEEAVSCFVSCFVSPSLSSRSSFPCSVPSVVPMPTTYGSTWVNPT